MSEFNLQSALAAIAARRDESLKSITVTVDPDSPRERIARAQQQEQDIISQVEWLENQEDSPLKTQRLHAAMDRLGELAAEQGEFERAAVVSHSPERRAYYESIVIALAQPEGADCECPADRVVDTNGVREYYDPSMMNSETIVTPDGGQRILKVCRKCGFKSTK